MGILEAPILNPGSLDQHQLPFHAWRPAGRALRAMSFHSISGFLLGERRLHVEPHSTTVNGKEAGASYFQKQDFNRKQGYSYPVNLCNAWDSTLLMMMIFKGCVEQRRAKASLKHRPDPMPRIKWTGLCLRHTKTDSSCYREAVLPVVKPGERIAVNTGHYLGAS